MFSQLFHFLLDPMQDENPIESPLNPNRIPIEYQLEYMESETVGTH